MELWKHPAFLVLCFSYLESHTHILVLEHCKIELDSHILPILGIMSKSCGNISPQGLLITLQELLPRGFMAMILFLTN